MLEACGAASHDSIMGKVTLVAPGRGSQKAAFRNWVLALQAQRTNSGLVHQSPFCDVTLPFKLGTVFQCVCLLRVSGGVHGTKGVVRYFGLGLEDGRGNHGQCDDFWIRLNRFGAVNGPHTMTTSVRLVERMVRETLIAEIVVFAFQALMPLTSKGFYLTHIAGNADVSRGGVVNLLTLFGGGVGDGCARPPIFRILPPTFRILR